MITRTSSDNPDFVKLTSLLDVYLAEKDGEERDFYAAYNTLTNINNVVLFYDGNECLGCGAFKEYEPGVAEIKRMYVMPEKRGAGIAFKVLSELEAWAAECGYTKCILECGKLQTEAIAFYRKMNYSQIPNSGQYEHINSCMCFEKKLQ